MDLGGGSAHTSGNEGAGLSGVAGGDSDAVLRSVTQQVMAEIVHEIEKVLTVLQCREEQRVLFATYKLAEEAKRWWIAVKLLEQERIVPIEMTWDQKVKIEELLNLKQGEQTVQQYVAKFIELSRFVPYIIPDKTKKVRRFERGLRQELHKQVSILKLQDFSELVNRAAMVEAGERLEAEEHKHRKRFTPFGSQ
ncbi:uncharacterized protein LOC131145682 [Malania oleifera]|uniref:uncharacterized protein LOC131145682 n=1 Tax=Malania oleifera TaxID=397392 RepID=UPI0025AE6B8A|nr:uncharacterized protein LOC131145682 [Malania oleifera]